MPYALTAAHGAELKIGNGASTELFNELQGMHNGPNGMSDEWNIIQARHHGSTSTFQKRTFKEPSNLTFDLFYDSSDTHHAALMAAARSGTRKNFELTLTDNGAEVFEFSAYVSATISADVEGFNIASITLSIDGDVLTS